MTLIDFKAGFEDSARGVLTSLDWAIEIVDPTTATVQMAVSLKEMVRQIRAGNLLRPGIWMWRSPSLPRESLGRLALKVLVVLNRITNGEVESYLKEELKKNRLEPIGTVHEDPSITASWLRGTPLRADQSSKDAEQIVEALEAAERSSSASAAA